MAKRYWLPRPIAKFILDKTGKLLAYWAIRAMDEGNWHEAAHTALALQTGATDGCGPDHEKCILTGKRPIIVLTGPTLQKREHIIREGRD